MTLGRHPLRRATALLLAVSSLADKPHPGLNCCLRNDYTGQFCAYQKLTPESCAAIKAGHDRAMREQSERDRATIAFKRRASAIGEAVTKNDVPGLRRLMTDETNPPNVRQSPGFLTQAARAGSRDVVQELIAAGVSVDHRDDVSKKSALVYASENGYGAIVGALIVAGADVDSGDRDEKTALMYASEKGYVDVVLQLLNAGADTNRRSIWGHTALWWAHEGKQDQAAEILVARGARRDP